ncbi:MAG: vitamin K epoxide reductase family protein [Thermoleophilia bacterium]|nr:vitamin K epoxide reductase family protein [Thermoleophilia bacterium]
MVITGYLSYERFSGGTPTCIIGGGCATVQSSRYAEIFGVSLSYLGLITYALILASAFIPGFPGRLLAVVMGIGGLLFSLWLLYAEIALIHALCPWCLASLVVMVFSLTVAVWRVISAGDLRAGST